MKVAILICICILSCKEAKLQNNDKNLNIYNEIWKELTNNFFDQKKILYHKDKSYEAYKEKVLRSDTREEFVSTVNQLFNSFKCSHLRLFSKKESATTNQIQKQKSAGKKYKINNKIEVNIIFDTTTIVPKVGLIRLNIFADPIYLLPKFRNTLKQFSAYKGIIIDIRNNPGGNLLIVSSILQCFFSNVETIAYLKSQNSDTPITLNSPKPIFNKKIAVLINQYCQSGAELFAAVLQEFNKAKLFGSRTSGAVLLANIKPLSDEYILEYPYAEIITSKGKKIEGTGVLPNYQIENINNKDTDAVIDAAIKWIIN